MGTVWVVLFCSGLVAGLLATLFQLPGTFVVAGTILVAGACTGWSAAPLWLVLIALVAAIAAEVGDNVLSAWALKRYEGSSRGMWSAVLGGFVGAIVGGSLSSLLGALGLVLGPVVGVALFVIGPIAGGCAGGWTGAFLAERSLGRSPSEARKAALGAFLGRAAGVLMKVVVCLLVSGWAASYVVPRLLGRVVA